MQALNERSTGKRLLELAKAARSYTAPSRRWRCAGPRYFLASWLSCLAVLTASLPQPVDPDLTSRISLSGRYIAASSLAAPNSTVPSQYFAATGKSTRGDFLALFQKYGLARIGYPIADEREENGRIVQYFERARLEQAPGAAGSGGGVTMGRLGVELTEGQQFVTVKPFTSTSRRVYVKETNHSLEQAFLDYWKQNGGLELFGYPISEPIKEDGLIVQWFERARFEYHPELVKSGRPVQLTLLGRDAMEKARADGDGNGDSDSGPQTSPPASAAPPPVSLTPEEDYLFKAINEQRAAAGLQPVRLDSPVVELARSRSNDMAGRSYFSHQTPEGTNFISMMSENRIKYKFAGEILARNNFPDGESEATAINSYLNSPAHKGIMLDGRFQLVGVSHSKAADQMHYYAVIFVQP